MSPRLLLALLAALLAIGVLSGCGSSDSLSSEAVARAADATVAKGGTKISIASDSVLPGGGQLTMSGEGAVNTKTQQGHLTLKAIAAPPSVDKATLTQDLVFDRFVFYMRSPAFAAALENGKKWVKIDLIKAGKAAGIDLTLLSQTGQDPTQSLRLLKAVSGEVKKVGDEDVRGVKTQHYKATVDLKKYPDTVPAKDRAAAQSTIDNLIKRLGSSTSPVEFWIDDDHLIRRYAQTLKLKVAGGASSIKQRIEYYDYGSKVDVSLPPAGEVRDLTDIAAQGLRKQTP